jgi:dihydroflavonol-4-reductase
MIRHVRVYVTGASGFVGSHVARLLREAGADVRDEWIDLLDAARLRAAIDGCEAVFHVAALYSYSRRDAAAMERVNVEGTRNVVSACRAAGVRRLVHTSTCGTCGPVVGRDATEEDGPPAWELAVAYKRTKLAAERLVLESGLDAVVVNPTTPVGEGNRFATPTRRMLDGIASGRFLGWTDGGINVVDVRDVALGHVLALEHGRAGERYLLGGANLTLRELFFAVADLAGVARPLVRVPYSAVRLGARLGLVNRDEALLARVPAWFSAAKAERELGYRPGPVEPALARAVAASSIARGEPPASAQIAAASW